MDFDKCEYIYINKLFFFFKKKKEAKTVALQGNCNCEPERLFFFKEQMR